MSVVVWAQLRYYSIYIISESCPFILCVIYIDGRKRNMFTICPLLSFNHYRLIYMGTVLELYYIYYTGVVPIYPMHYIYISDNGYNK